MGGAYGLGPDEDEDIVGIIPRVIRDLFAGIKEKQSEHIFNVKVSYLEVSKLSLHMDCKEQCPRYMPQIGCVHIERTRRDIAFSLMSNVA